MMSLDASKVVPVEQLNLFEIEVKGSPSVPSNGKSTFSDPPFAGVGTTLVESVLSGHNTIGFEINPYAALACRVKLNAHLIDTSRLSSEIQRFQNFYKDAISTNYIPRSTVPKGFKTRAEFYSPEVLHKVLITQDFMDTVADTNLRSLFKLVFAATMVSYSNYSYEPSLSRRVTSGKEEIRDFPVVQTILGKLAEVVKDVDWFQAHLPDRQVETCIFDDSFFQYKTHLAPQSVDLIITSPPYLNNYHYNRNTRPQLYWLGYMEHPQDFKLLEYSNFGKYW